MSSQVGTSAPSAATPNSTVATSAVTTTPSRTTAAIGTTSTRTVSTVWSSWPARVLLLIGLILYVLVPFYGRRRRLRQQRSNGRGGDVPQRTGGSTGDVETGRSASPLPPQSPPPGQHYYQQHGVSQPLWGGTLPPGVGPAHTQPVAMRITTSQGTPGVVYAYPVHRSAASALVPFVPVPVAAPTAASSGPGGTSSPRPRFDVTTLHSFKVAEKNRDESCPICLGPLHEENVSLGPCLHIAHTSCLQSWLLKDKECSCPICREPFVEQPGASGELDAAVANATDAATESPNPVATLRAEPGPVQPFPQQFNSSVPNSSPEALPAGPPLGAAAPANHVASLYPPGSNSQTSIGPGTQMPPPPPAQMPPPPPPPPPPRLP